MRSILNVLILLMLISPTIFSQTPLDDEVFIIIPQYPHTFYSGSIRNI